MAMRASGSSAPPTMPRLASAAVSPNRIAALNSRCTSRSERIGLLQDRLRGVRLVEQDLERGQIGVPFEQCRLGAKALDGRAVKRPYRGRDACAVVIDQAPARSIEAGKMNLRHGIARDGVDEQQRVETVI